MSFKSKLYNISEDIKLHNATKSKLLTESINDRLDFALKSYSDEIANSYNYLITKGSIRVMDKLNKR